ncbi:HAD-IA family hydrolase [Streptomyces sp. CAU 1734]|uniref:HAD family hydrolase n=1 Tax=Streptomyces sp. CAU 1734 TaxID=3140360 RepID=UPI00326176C9
MTASHPTAVPGLFTKAGCVLFDFDGPVCHLFAGHPAAAVAAGLRRWAAGRVPGGLPVPPGPADDPLALLRAAAVRDPGGELVREMERRLTAEEITAAGTARPTEGADELIRRLDAAGFRLAVTTNNSAAAVRRYLARPGTADRFGRHVHGRRPDPALMKPDPDCLRRALETTGSTAAEALMIGDSAADCEAAARLGVAFLGYARTPAKRERLAAAGATEIVAGMTELTSVLDTLETGRP